MSIPSTRNGYLSDRCPSQTIKDVRASEDVLVDLFGRMEFFFKRLEAYIKVRPTVAMRDIIVKIMVEVISILGIVTKEIRQGRTSMLFPFPFISLRNLTFKQRSI